MKRFFKKILISLKRKKLHKVATFHESTIFGKKARINSHKKEDVVIGSHTSFHASIHSAENASVSIGKNSTIRYKTHLGAAVGITIGNRVIISNSVFIIDNDSHPTDVESRDKLCDGDHQGEMWSSKYAKKAPIVIEDSVWIGNSAMILKGVTIGKGSIVAAGAIVTKNVPPYSLCYGNPAKIKEGVVKKHP